MKWRKAVILTALAVLLIETAGCKANRFATYSQDEKKEYIAEKLNDRYQISCEFSEVEKRVVDVFDMKMTILPLHTQRRVIVSMSG